MQLHENHSGFFKSFKLPLRNTWGRGIGLCLFKDSGEEEVKGRRRKEGSWLAAGWFLHQTTLLLGNS